MPYSSDKAMKFFGVLWASQFHHVSPIQPDWGCMFRYAEMTSFHGIANASFPVTHASREFQVPICPSTSDLEPLVIRCMFNMFGWRLNTFENWKQPFPTISIPSPTIDVSASMIGCFIEDWTDWTLTNVDDEVKCYFNNTRAITMHAILCLCVSFIRDNHQIPLSSPSPSGPMICIIRCIVIIISIVLFFFLKLCVFLILYHFYALPLSWILFILIYIYICIFYCIMYMFNMFRYNVFSCCLYKNRIIWVHN